MICHSYLMEAISKSVTAERREYRCMRCSYRWFGRIRRDGLEDERTTDVKACPHCKSRYWNKPKLKEDDENLILSAIRFTEKILQADIRTKNALEIHNEARALVTRLYMSLERIKQA